MSQLSAWALFLGEEGPPSPPSLKAVQLAREDAAAARESAAEMSDRVDLLQAMLAIMEREISLRQNQLDLTTEMLRATETEVRRVVGGRGAPCNASSLREHERACAMVLTDPCRC